MSESENRPEAEDPLHTRTDDQEGRPVDEFGELQNALLRLQEERREGLQDLINGVLNGTIHSLRMGLKSDEKEAQMASGLNKYLQAQNDIERLMFLMVHVNNTPPQIVGYPDVDVLDLARRLYSGGGVVVPAGATVRRTTALEALAQMTDNPAILPDLPYRDAVGHPAMPNVSPLITYSDSHIPGEFPGQDAPTITFIEMGANKIPASKVSSIGCAVARFSGEWRECVFVRFKGGDLYRYWPFRNRPVFVWQEMVTICQQMAQALQVSLTVGEYVERVLKTAHDQGLVICEKLENGRWAAAMTREQLAAHRAANPPQRKKKGLRPEDISLSGEPYPEAIRRGGPDGPTDADHKEDRDNALGRGGALPEF